MERVSERSFLEEQEAAPISVLELNCELASQLRSSLVKLTFVMIASELRAQVMKLGCWEIVYSVPAEEPSCSSLLLFSYFVTTHCCSDWSCHSAP